MFIKQQLTLIMLLGALLGGCRGASDANAVTTDNQVVKEEIPTFNADSAYSYIKAQVDCGPRVPGTPGHDKCAAYIVEALGRFGADTVLQQKATVTAFNGDRLPINNIMGRFNPRAKERVLLLAHWDTRPWADAEEDESKHNTPIPGANDGGSGVGVLLELARQMGMKNPGVGVDLLFVDAEDYGSSGYGNEDSWCLGTQYWTANMPYGSDDKPQYAILLDMVGGINARFHREPLSQYAASSIVDKVWIAAKAAGYGDVFVNEPGSAVVDDHLYVNQAGIPTIDIIESMNGNTRSFPDTWHTLADDMSSISTQSLKAVGQTLMQILYKH